MTTSSAAAATPKMVSLSTERGVSIHLWRADPNPYRATDDMAISLRFEADLAASQAWIGSAAARALAVELVRQCDAFDADRAALHPVDREFVL